jgi:hypothetical protein
MLHQDGVQRIEVIVKKSGGYGQVGAKETDAEDVAGNSGGEIGGEELAGTGKISAKTKRFIKTNATHTVAVTKQVADLVLEYEIAGLSNKYGDEAYQDSVQRSFEIMKDTGGLASSIAIGATYGSAGGPAGAIIGATLAAVSTGFSLASKYKGRERDYGYKLFKENNAIEYQRARASINMTTGRLR